MNKPGEIIELTKFIEANFDVNKLCYKGVRFWPMLRLEITANLCLKTTTPNFKSRHIETRNLNYSLKLPFRLIKYLYYNFKFKSTIYNTKFDNLLCVYPLNCFIDKIDNKLYSRYLDPYYEILKDKINIERINFSEEIPLNINFHHPVTLVNTNLFLKYNFLKNLLFPKNKYNATEFSKIKSTIAELNDIINTKYNFKPIPLGILNLVEEYIFNYKYFTYFFKKNTKVKNIFLDCFYNPVKMALTAAAKASNVNVIEIQHGGAEDNVYIPYTNKNIDFEMIPNYLWCWSESDKELILNYNGNKKFLKPIIGGNMWLKKFVEGEMLLDTKYTIFLNELKTKQCILICLQTLIGLTDIMLETITKLGSNYYFLVRLHPITSTKEKETIYKQLMSFSNIEIENSSTINLYNLFNYVKFQITHSSTTAMEALSFKLPTIICSEFGYDFYKVQIQKNVIFYAKDYNNIEEIIINNKKLNYENVNYFLIKTNANEALKNILPILKN